MTDRQQIPGGWIPRETANRQTIGNVIPMDGVPTRPRGMWCETEGKLADRFCGRNAHTIVMPADSLAPLPIAAAVEVQQAQRDLAELRAKVASLADAIEAGDYGKALHPLAAADAIRDVLL